MAGTHFQLDYKQILLEESRKIQINNPPYSGYFHSRYELFFSLGGRCSFFIKDSLYIVKENEIILVPPNSIHATTFPNRQYKHQLLNFSDYYINPTFKKDLVKIFNSGKYIIAKEDQEFFRSLLESIKLAAESKDAYSETLLKTYFDQLFIKLIRTKEQFSKKNINALFSREIAKSLSYINKYYSKKITLEEVADLLHITPSHFSRTFSKDLGLTFIQYLVFTRLKAAEKLLLESDLSILDISVASGFNDSTYFATVFKKHYGMPPSDFRKHQTLL